MEGIVSKKTKKSGLKRERISWTNIVCQFCFNNHTTIWIPSPFITSVGVQDAAGHSLSSPD